jgi:hypothetical protein
MGEEKPGNYPLTGGCACGAVRYSLDRGPIFVHNCYCTLCQKQTGSTSIVNFFVETEALTRLSGETVRHIAKTGTGRDQHIMRCAECGTAVWSHYPRLGELGVAVRVGTFDDPGAVTPDVAIFTADRMPWVTLPEGIPHFEQFYDFAEVLPPERLARMQALAAKRAAQQASA